MSKFKTVVSQPAVDFHEVTDYLEETYDIHFRDMAKSHGHFSDWADSKGYTHESVDPDGKQRLSSQIWFKEYKTDPLGERICPPYQDCWHWLLDHDFSSFQRGINYLSFDSINDPKTPDYVKEFLIAFRKEVIDHEAFDEKSNMIACDLDW